MHCAKEGANPMEKKNRRSKVKYPALDPTYNLKTRVPLIDYDYLDKLSDKEKEWLNSFTEEYTNANFNHKGKKIQKRKKHTKDAYDRNNARNRDILTREIAQGAYIALEEKHTYNPEDEWIDKIDKKKSKG